MTTRRAARRVNRITGREREVAQLLRALADSVEDGRATANLRIEIDRQGEVWIVAARVERAAEPTPRASARGTGAGCLASSSPSDLADLPPAQIAE